MTTKRILVKTAIWRAIATLITFFSAWVITGDITFGLLVGGLDTVLKTIGYFFYENHWSKNGNT